MLHFLNPKYFAIWDSRVYAFLNGKYPWDYQIQKSQRYRDYLKLLKALSKDPRALKLRSAVNKGLGYEVTMFRALELVMFDNAPSRQAS